MERNQDANIIMIIIINKIKNPKKDRKNKKPDKMPPAISIKNLTYNYPDGTNALENISLEILKGESVAILGPNGAGKSTLLLHLNGILKGNNGIIKIFNNDLKNKKKEEIIREVGVVFQDPDCQLFMPTVFDDVAFGPINMNLPEDEVRDRVCDALKKVNMSDYKDKCPHHLSFGEKKKISFAGVLSMNPEIVVLDEPTANLDPRSRRDLIEIIKKLKNEGKTLVIATHDLNAIPEIVDKIYVLNKTLIAGGTAREIFLNTKLLKSQNLDIPETGILFEILSCFGYDCTDLPLTADEAMAHLTKTLVTEGGHIHLHLHKHTHDKIAEFKKNREHHPHI